MGGCDEADRQPRRWKTSTRLNKPLGGSGSDTQLRRSHTESSSSSAGEEEYVKEIRRRRERLRTRRRLNTILKDEDSTTTTTTEGEEDDKEICDADDEASSRRCRVVVPVAAAGEGGCFGKDSGFVWEYTEQPEPQEVDRARSLVDHALSTSNNQSRKRWIERGRRESEREVARSARPRSPWRILWTLSNFMSCAKCGGSLRILSQGLRENLVVVLLNQRVTERRKRRWRKE